jgi:hypothetical protein
MEHGVKNIRLHYEMIIELLYMESGGRIRQYNPLESFPFRPYQGPFIKLL